MDEIRSQLDSGRRGVAHPASPAPSERAHPQDPDVESLCREVLERYEEVTFVYRLCERIGAVLDESALARLVLSDVLAVLGADAGEVWLRCGEGLSLAASAPGEAAPLPLPAIAEVAETGRTWVLDDERGAAAAAAVALPSSAGTPLGVIALFGRPTDRTYRTGEVRLLTAVASLTAAFVRNIRFGEAVRRADARRREDDIAYQVHRGLFPRHEPVFPGLEVSGGFRAAEWIGGDYYGYVPMPDGSLGVAVADVAGHGVGAALFMAIAKGALESEARARVSPAEILTRVNRVVASDLGAADLFATFFFAGIRPGGREIRWASAGHNPPVVLRASGEVAMLPPSGPALGLTGAAGWSDAATPLATGDVVVVYTDGVVEARDSGRQPFGLERLVAAARRPGASAATIREHILLALARHTGPVAPSDDRTVVVLRAVPDPEAP